MNTLFSKKPTGKIDVMGFLAKDTFLPITYPLSIFLAVGFSGLLIYNYATTYIGFAQTFPALWWWVALGFTAVVQGVQLVIPIIESFSLHEDLPFGWRMGMWLGWVLSIVADFYTAIVALAFATGLALTAKFVLFDSALWQSGAGFLLVIFGMLLITAEIWVVLSWRAVFQLHRPFWDKLESALTGLGIGRPSQPNAPRATSSPMSRPAQPLPSFLPRAQSTMTPTRPTPPPAPARPEPTYRPAPRPTGDHDHDTPIQ